MEHSHFFVKLSCKWRNVCIAGYIVVDYCNWASVGVVYSPTRWSLWYWYWYFFVAHFDTMRNIAQQCATALEQGGSIQFMFFPQIPSVWQPTGRTTIGSLNPPPIKSNKTRPSALGMSDPIRDISRGKKRENEGNFPKSGTPPLPSFPPSVWECHVCERKQIIKGHWKRPAEYILTLFVQ